MMAPPARSMPSMASFLEDDDVLRTLRTVGAGVCDVRHAVRALGRKLPFRAPDAGVMVAHQVARPVPGHRDGPRGPYGGVGGRLAASAPDPPILAARGSGVERRQPPDRLV